MAMWIVHERVAAFAGFLQMGVVVTLCGAQEGWQERGREGERGSH